MEFDLNKFRELPTNKKKSKYDFLYTNKELTKELLEAIKRGSTLTTITEELNRQIGKGENYLNTISLKENLKSIIETNGKEEYKDLFKTRTSKKTRKKRETKPKNEGNL